MKKSPATSSTSRNKTPRRQKDNKGNYSPEYLRRSARKRTTTSNNETDNTKKTKHSDSHRDVPTTAYQLPQLTDNEVVRNKFVVSYEW